MSYARNDSLKNPMLPMEIVLAPAWWYHHEGITFDEDFFYHPARRVEVERKMEGVLQQRWGRFGLGVDHDRELPLVGAVHLAAGYLISEMLGCRVNYSAGSPPEVICANRDSLEISPDDAFGSPAYKRLENLTDALKTRFGYLAGDINFSGILNIALDLRGQTFFMDMVDKPDAAARLIADIAALIDRFTTGLSHQTGSTSISVNRTVGHIDRPVFLHSECSHVMVSVADYEKFLMPLDIEWSRRHRPFGIHYCGKDPHRYAESFAKLPRLDFLDVGSGGDVSVLRRHLPNTFLNVRYSPVEIVGQAPEEIRQSVRELVHAAENPWLTGVCCINMDEQVSDEQITAIFEEVEELREEYAAG